MVENATDIRESIVSVYDTILEFFLDSVQTILNFLLELNQTLGLTGWLIVLTLVITFVSYRSQKRAAIREAIEQLDPRATTYREVRGPGRNIQREIQVKAGLNRFSFFTRRSEIAFFSNRIHSRSDRVVDHSVPPYYLTIPERNSSEYHSLQSRILSIEKVRLVERTETQLIIICSTTNPVECRQIASDVLDEHDCSEDNLIHISHFRPHQRSR